MQAKFEAILKSIVDGTLEIKAKSEAEAQSKINKALKQPKYYGYKVMKTKGGYYGNYELRQTFNGYVTGTSYTEFNLTDKGNGFYGITYNKGYQGID